jgi:hypothetical protein
MSGFVIFVVVLIVVSLINKARQQSSRRNGTPSPRVQAMIERIQAQQGGNQPTQFQGQFTQAAGQGGPPPARQTSLPAQTGSAPGSEQVAAVLETLLQNGRQPRHLGERNSPGQASQQPGNPTPYAPAGQYQPPGQFQPVQFSPIPYQPPAHRPQQNRLPTPNQDLDAKIRDLMNANNEVGAIRLLSEERRLGILEAQAYARSLVAPKATSKNAARTESEEEEGRYVGSAAFAESIFNLDDPDENVWASGWVDTPEPEDRSDIDELWQTVSKPPRPDTKQPNQPS